ncbi:hypothetical protein [Leptospira ellisii]|uniref:hypothetical protein n=1 Tax=Leptospira ellisii TaxID=2023197 RepID=UPI001A9F383E|nr:hypothetical protein [Leptospira ellisii]
MNEQLKSIRNIGPDLKTKVIALLHDHESGLVEFKSRIGELSHNNPFFYSDFFRIISHLEIQEHEARELWEDIYKHGESMSSSLGRNVNFVVSMLDYIFSKNRIIENPKIVELYSFEEIILNTVIDETSGIYNRRYFNIILNKEINRSSRYQRDFSASKSSFSPSLEIRSYNSTNPLSRVISSCWFRSIPPYRLFSLLSRAGPYLQRYVLAVFSVNQIKTCRFRNCELLEL